MDKTSLGDRMKDRYENIYRHRVITRMPIIIRVDGKAFHTLTRGADKPFDNRVANSMDVAAQTLMKEIQGARIAYVQSDEISVLIIGYNTYASEAFFNGNIQKMVSVAASIAGVEFSLAYGKKGYFDGRVFNVPESEVCNAFLFRQQDATRNAIQMVGQAHFSHKQLHCKSCDDIQEMLFQEKGVNFNDVEPYWKRGRVVLKDGTINRDIPIFSQSRPFIEQHLRIDER